jgi:hypothetical protein
MATVTPRASANILLEQPSMGNRREVLQVLSKSDPADEKVSPINKFHCRHEGRGYVNHGI